MQVDLGRLSSIQVRISWLVATHGDAARDSVIKLFYEWESIAARRKRDGNPLPEVPALYQNWFSFRHVSQRLVK